MQFFYVLINGICWKLASKLVKNTAQYEKTLNRKFNLWVRDDIFKNLCIRLTNNYKENNKVYDLKIDSTDIMNANCNKCELGRSWKLHKQSIKATFIVDSNNIPIAHSLDIPTKNDSKAGYELILKLPKNKNKKIYLAGDKGYKLNDDDVKNIMKSKNICLVTPKKIYKNKEYKTKNYKRKVKTIRHSKQMKNILTKRIYIEHFNSIIHRSFKRLDKIYDKTLTSFNGFIDLALSIVINRKLN